MKKHRKPLLPASLALLMLIASSQTGCALFKRKVLVLPADRTIGYLPQGASYRATNSPMYLVPPALMLDMVTVFNRLQTNQ